MTRTVNKSVKPPRDLDSNFSEMIRHSRTAGTLWTLFTDAHGRQLISGSETLPSRESLILAEMGRKRFDCFKDAQTGHSVMDGPHYLTRAEAERMIDRYLGRACKAVAA